MKQNDEAPPIALTIPDSFSRRSSGDRPRRSSRLGPGRSLSATALFMAPIIAASVAHNPALATMASVLESISHSVAIGDYETFSSEIENA